MIRLLPLLLGSALGLFVTSGCVYDSDQRCSPHQVELSNDRCACEPGFVLTDAGCVACAENEEESAGSCVCVAGYARPTDGAACEEIPRGLGEECDPEAADECSEDYPACHATERAGAYCTTTGCSTSEDCEAGYMCQKEGSGTYCRRPPLGYGEKCETQDDCAEGEATFCETLQTNLCIVPCTAESTEVCFEGEVCCDFSQFNAGTVCTPAASCVAPGVPLGGP